MKKKTLYGASAICLLFTACSADQLSEPEVNNGPLDRDQTFYVNMSISGDIPDGTRAASDDGTPDAGTDFATGDENTVNNAYFVFYDADGQVVGDIVPIELNEAHLDVDENKNDDPQGPTVERSYKSIVPVSVRKGENKPTQVICYINPISPSSLQNPLNVIQTRARDVVYTDGAGGAKYFAMSNSVYYPDGEEAPRIAVPIPAELLFDTEEEAEAAIKEANGKAPNPDYVEGSDESGKNNQYLQASDAKLVRIYVERYATKLTFEAPQTSNIETYKTATRVYKNNSTAYDAVSVELTFNPEYWAVNGESKTTYVIKSFREESELGEIMATNYTRSALNRRINSVELGKYGDSDPILGDNERWSWNNATYHRSYWSMSPAYFTAKYPEVASDVTETLNQTYLKYSELPNKGIAVSSTNRSQTGYFKETTVGVKALTADNPAAAVASVIFVGKYNLKIGGKNVSIPTGKGFYTYLTGPVDGVEDDRPYVYFDNAQNSTNSVILDGTTPVGESMLKRFLAQATILFKANTVGTKTTYTRLSIADENDLTKLASSLAVMEIDEKVKGYVGLTSTETLKLQGNARSLQFVSASAATENGIFIASGDGYKQIVADDATSITENQIKISEANAILMQQVGYAYYYLNGEGYFNIPVKHFGWYRGGNTQKNAKKIDWTKVRVGDFGMVRNHSYTVSVSKITGLASGIGGNDISIVPPANTDSYYVAYSVRILKWAVVPTQNEEL